MGVPLLLHVCGFHSTGIESAWSALERTSDHAVVTLRQDGDQLTARSKAHCNPPRCLPAKYLAGQGKEESEQVSIISNWLSLLQEVVAQWGRRPPTPFAVSGADVCRITPALLHWWRGHSEVFCPCPTHSRAITSTGSWWLWHGPANGDPPPPQEPPCSRGEGFPASNPNTWGCQASHCLWQLGSATASCKAFLTMLMRKAGPPGPAGRGGRLSRAVAVCAPDGSTPQDAWVCLVALY